MLLILSLDMTSLFYPKTLIMPIALIKTAHKISKFNRSRLAKMKKVHSLYVPAITFVEKNQLM